ncbi:MAG: Holliday junction branch migration protein RuvA [Candidatus Levybacteria bacterium]|nr:Holliday junction branch migration protein RuvA [Candidatus Levybacteria bacterium]
MIGSLRGKVILQDGNHILVETGGVGYRVLVSSKVLSGKKNGEITLFTYTHVREDALELFGFPEISDLKLFENLIGVSGVGPKTAMAIFSFSDRESIVNAVLKGDVDFFTKVPRLGKKNAQKIIIELKSKLGDTSILDLNSIDSKDSEEVFTALKSFGFSHKEITDALKNIDKEAKTSEDKIKLALKYLGK